MSLLDKAVLMAAQSKSGWSEWRLRRWLGSYSITNGGTRLPKWLHREVLFYYNYLQWMETL